MSSSSSSDRKESSSSFEDIAAAVMARDVARVRSLLAQMPGLATAVNDRRWTPLHVAARYGAVEAVTALVAAGADVRATNSDGRTPIDLAVSWNFPECAAAMGSSNPAAVTTSVDNANGGGVQHFAGSPLNRASEMREDAVAATLSTAQFLPLADLKIPLFLLNDKKDLVWLDHGDVLPLLASGAMSDPVFLGFDDSGRAFWAVDATNVPEVLAAVTARGGEFKEPRPHAMSASRSAAAIYAQARSIIDWNTRNKFCPACGARTVSRHAGYKRECPTATCIANKGVQNISYPRTDAVVIMAIVSPDGDRILLGRQKTWPPKMYSCIAGFLEPGESVEEAARREAREETGVVVGRVTYHASQPWPFPSQLMIGLIGEALTEDINLADKELEDARFFSREQVLAALAGNTTGDLSIPFSTAIAHTLIRHWADTPNPNAKPKI